MTHHSLTLNTKVTSPRIRTRQEINYDCFVAELTQLTRKYGVALQSVGGVYLANEPGGFREVTYRADITSGDLYPEHRDWV